jgi:hypothetical protein
MKLEVSNNSCNESMSSGRIGDNKFMWMLLGRQRLGVGEDVRLGESGPSAHSFIIYQDERFKKDKVLGSIKEEKIFL